MERLEDSLKIAEREVRRCKNKNAMVKAFDTDEIARDLDRLRQDISEKIFSSILLTSVETKSQCHSIGDSTEDPSNDNKTMTKKAGVASMGTLVRKSIL
ncbi:hypothetical protein HU200_049096 [Digitaria exilis]|uniref:Uncharacterized protein n=1 Tax=Digitaria exilis TaxID=1010633 RepID=A0A835ATX8_9POAL|nr:hypothetical protein HU200_049096 [Digitaria exilis]